MVGVLIRAVTYATLFIGVVLVYLPALHPQHSIDVLHLRYYREHYGG